MKKDFWRKSKVAVLGGGSWGTILATLVARNCAEVRLWVRSEEMARSINSTRTNPKYFPQVKLADSITATHEIDRALDGQADAVVWALPSKACRERAKEFASKFKGDEILIHATKGVEPVTLKRISRVLREEIPCPRIGVISGPNLAAEIARGEPAGTVVASAFDEVISAGKELLSSDRFRVYGEKDVIGVEWAGTLKNVLSIASGGLEGLNLGMNTRSMLLSRGLAEMVRFGIALGAKESTFLGLAGIGDVLATCMSPLSRNYQVGYGLAQGKTLDQVVKDLGSTAEGVRTTQSVWEFAKARDIPLPITGAVYEMLEGRRSVSDALDFLMKQPVIQ